MHDAAIWFSQNEAAANGSYIQTKNTVSGIPAVVVREKENIVCGATWLTAIEADAVYLFDLMLPDTFGDQLSRKVSISGFTPIGLLRS